MKLNYPMMWSVLAGFAVGAASLQALHAQQARTAPAYVIAEVAPRPAREADPAAMARYNAEAPKTIAAFNGRYLVISNKARAVEGDPPKGTLVVLAFDSLEQARGWYNSPAYKAIRPFRQNSTLTRMLIVEGLAPK
jgi:uncharacterized protein (DUF1330 family)